MSGVSERQQNGYECTMEAASTNRPSALTAATMSLSQSLTWRPAKAGTAAVNAPSSSTGQGKAPPRATIPPSKHTRMSSSPNAGAQCTTPVPESAVT